MARIILLLLLVSIIISSYTDALAQQRLLQVPNLSQRSNVYFLRSSEGIMYISSTDGLNIFDGIHTRVLKPGLKDMVGSNIQGEIFEDQNGLIWFATYNALHVYNPKSESINHYFVVNNQGDTIKDNYKTIFLDQANLALKARNQFVKFNIITRKQEFTYEVDLLNKQIFESIKKDSIYYLYTLDGEGLDIYKFNRNSFEPWQNRIPGYFLSLLILDDNVLLGTADGKLMSYDGNDMQLKWSHKISFLPISGLTMIGPKTILGADKSNSLFKLDIENPSNNTRVIFDTVSSCQSSLTFRKPYFDSDSKIWVGSSGDGTYFYDYSKNKFDLLLQGYDITKIVRRFNDFIILTRSRGIIVINREGDILFKYEKLPGESVEYTARNGVLLENNNLLFSASNNLFVLDFNLNKIIKLTIINFNGRVYFEQIDRLANGKIIASANDQFLFNIEVSRDTAFFSTYGNANKWGQQSLYFKEDASGNLYVSNDEKNILVFTPGIGGNNHTYKYTIPIGGGVWSLCDNKNLDHFYIGNSQGMYKIEKEKYLFQQIVDKNKLLLQTIYSILQDDAGNLWTATNKGIIKYYPSNNESKVFSLMDGIQSSEYNSHASLLLNDGHMLFGGVNGLNYFHPDSVKFSEKPAPIYISEVLINDEPNSIYHVPQYINNYNLSYKNNTVSFEFHAIDYSDPEATRVHYKLIGVDREYVESKSAKGFARYANLRPGHYTFSIMGKNSDGVINETPREIDITIHPPYWMTWWFFALVSGAALSITYYAIRTYYKRKLDRKNQLLREQALIIERQEAVEHERTRIASEMHDDLGSGLTTIRYLSDKALKQAKDQTEVDQIKNIAEQSNKLVRNMSEIIWAMNSRFDDAGNLIAYLRRYASEYLEVHQLPVQFTISDNLLSNTPIGGEKRRNIFLVFKELLHNAVKYSRASKILINIDSTDLLTIHISEIDGIGFEHDTSKENGNGLYNMVKRMENIGGKISFEKGPNSMDIYISTPLKT